MQLTSDAYMLLSIVNTHLRDKYDSIEDLCQDNDIKQEDIDSILATIGYTYDPVLKRYI